MFVLIASGEDIGFSEWSHRRGNRWCRTAGRDRRSLKDKVALGQGVSNGWTLLQWSAPTVSCRRDTSCHIHVHVLEIAEDGAVGALAGTSEGASPAAAAAAITRTKTAERVCGLKAVVSFGMHLSIGGF